MKIGHELADAAIQRTRREAARSTEAPHPEASILSELPSAKEALHLAEGALRTWVMLWTTVIRATVPLAQGIVPEGSKIADALHDLLGKAFGDDAGGEKAASAGASKQTVSGQGTSARAISCTMLVQSARPARIALQLHRETTGGGLSVQPLFPVAKGADKQPITEVSLSTAKDGRSPELSVIIPDKQAPGRYLGAVYEEATGSVVGGLTIDLLG